MEYSTLFNLNSTMLKSEAEVETRLLAKLFNDLGYTDEYIVPKKHIPPVTVNEGSKKKTVEVDFFLLGQNKPGVIVEAKNLKFLLHQHGVKRRAMRLVITGINLITIELNGS